MVQMWRLPSLGQQRLGLFCVISAVRLTMVLQSMSFSVGNKHLLPWLPRGSCYQKVSMKKVVDQTLHRHIVYPLYKANFGKRRNNWFYQIAAHCRPMGVNSETKGVPGRQEIVTPLSSPWCTRTCGHHRPGRGAPT